MKSIGKYDQRITFRQLTEIDDGYGGSTPGWVDVLTTTARVEGVSTYQAIEQFEQKTGKLKRFFVKARKGFSPDDTMRIMYKGEAYTITTPQQIDGERIGLEWSMVGTTDG